MTLFCGRYFLICFAPHSEIDSRRSGLFVRCGCISILLRFYTRFQPDKESIYPDVKFETRFSGER